MKLVHLIKINEVKNGTHVKIVENTGVFLLESYENMVFSY